jgi:DNA-binding beta-propeller fold protein YncE
MKPSVLALTVLALAVPAAAQTPDPKVCDIDVLYIQRTPRYPGYLPHYDLSGLENQPTLVRKDEKGKQVPLAPQEVAKQKHWPDDGEEVTYTAVIENKGAADAPIFEYSWYLDSKEVSAGRSEKPLPPGKRAQISWKWPWKRERHRLEFWADPMRRIRQFSFANDQRGVWTHGKLLVCYADSVTYGSFAKSRNFLGTYSFEDWCQAHADWMNLLFERSVYPGTAAEGVLDRVAVDFIGLLEDDKAHQARWKEGPPLAEGWDGAWWFGRSADCARWAAGMDWGLIHEWGHQLGLTDLYCLDVAPESNHVLDKFGSPYLVGRLSVFHGTMMHGHGPVVFSEDQAIAMNRQLWRRRGYYGDYYYNLAEKNYVLVTDAAGKPVAGARLRFWQRNLGDGIFSGEPTFTGQTGPDGKFLLPNRPAPAVVTYGDAGGGYALKPNPFGLIHVVGVNGVFFVEVEARGQTDLAFLEIPEFNLAKEHQSAASATVQIATQAPPEGGPAAPPAPQVEVSGLEVRLTVAGAARWTAFRTDPGEYAWKKIGEGGPGPMVDKLPRSGMFRYAAAVEKGGRLSARSDAVGVAAMVEPWGLAVAPDGTTYVRDRASGQTLMLRPDGSAVGYVGSVHWHLEGSYDLATDAKGLVYVAKWPDGYDPKRSWIRRVDLKGKGREHDRTDLAGGPADSTDPGRFRQPMGIWVSPQDGLIVVADTGNDRVQILSADGKADAARMLTGLHKPHKALIANGRLVVCDTGAKRVVVYAWQDGAWKESKVFDDFQEPVYCCLGLSGSVWVADRGLGRVFAIGLDKWQKLDWSFPAPNQPRLEDLRGIAYEAGRGDLLYIDGKARSLGRRHVPD